MPKASTLPESLRDFAFRQALVVGRQQDFHPHVDRLIKALDATLAAQAAVQNSAAGGPSSYSNSVGT